MTAFTPHAVSAIVAQIAQRSDAESTFSAEYNGQMCDFEAKYETDWAGPFTEYANDRPYYEATCRLVGAWAYCPEWGHIVWAGNRDEAITLLGDKYIRELEADEAERQNDGGCEGDWE